MIPRLYDYLAIRLASCVVSLLLCCTPNASADHRVDTFVPIRYGSEDVKPDAVFRFDGYRFRITDANEDCVYYDEYDGVKLVTSGTFATVDEFVAMVNVCAEREQKNRRKSQCHKDQQK